MTGSPAEYGESENYGVITGLASGNTRTLTMSAFTNDSVTACTPTNWTLQALSEAVNDYVTTASGTGACNYTHPSPSVAGRLVWNWLVENMITASAGAGGTVSPVSAWCANDASAVFTATPARGYTFYCWRDADDNIVSYDAAYACPGASPQTLTAEFKSNVCVDSVNGDDEASGDADHPLKSIAAAIAKASDGTTIVLFTGTYELSAEVTLTTGLTLKGETGDPADVTITAASGYEGGLFTLNNANAVLDGLTFTGGKRPGSYTGGGAVLLSTNGGTVRNCVFHDNTTTGNASYGGAVLLNSDNALVTDCVFSNNCAYISQNGHTSDYGGGEAVYLAKGTLTKCLFVRNGEEDNLVNWALIHRSKGGIVRMVGGTLSYCTFAANRHPYCAGVWATGGTVTKCLFGANTSSVGITTASETWYGTASCFTDCVAPDYINDDCTVLANPFLCPEAEDWRPTLAAEGYGAIEAEAGAFTPTVYPSVREGVSPLTVTWTVATEGNRAVTCQWDWNGDGDWDETTSGTTDHAFTATANVKFKITDNATSAVYEPDAAIAIKSVPKTLYVSQTSENPSAPYSDMTTAAHTVAEAVEAAADGCEIIVAADTYDLTHEIVVDKDVTIKGATGNAADVVLRRKSGVTESRILRVSSPGALVCGVSAQDGTVYHNAEPYICYGSGIYLGVRGGIVSNCVIRSCCGGENLCCGDGFYIEENASSDALVTHCVVSNCVRLSKYNGDSGGVGAQIRGGTVRNTLFCYNKVTANSTTRTDKYGIVRVRAGRLENCTIVKNESYNCAGVWADGGEVVNCAIGLNTSDNQCALDPNTDVAWAGTASCFANCLAPVTINGNCFVENDSSTYKAPDSGDFSLNATSLGVDNGEDSDWMTNATDLALSPRIDGDHVDIGAYETEAGVFSASFTADKQSGTLPVTVTFTVETVNPHGEVTCYWDWNGDGYYDEITTSLTNIHTFTTAGGHGVRLKVNDGSGDYVVANAWNVKTAPSRLYVKPVNAGAAAPYDSWETAGTNLAEVVAYAVGGCDISLADGEYPIVDPIVLDAAIAVHGVSGDPERCVVRNTVSSTGDTPKRVFTINALGASVCNLSAADGDCETAKSSLLGFGGGIYLGVNGGMVSNCVVRDCQVYEHAGRGGGIYIESGADNALVTHTLVKNCKGGENQGVGAVCMAGGAMRNSIVTGNSCFSTWQGTSFSIVQVDGGVFENCTVASNRTWRCSGVTCSANGTARNCIILGNVTTHETQTLAVYDGEGTFDHCVGEVKINESCHVSTAAETFRNFEAGNFRTRNGSPARDGGVVCDWMSGATDFRGRRRVIGKPDCGAYECGGGFVLIAR